MLAPIDQYSTTDDVAPASSTAIDERRASGRIHARVVIKLIGFGRTDSLSCEAVNVGEGGVCVEGPEALGLSVGDRYEVVLQDDGGMRELASLFIDGVYATVVRTTTVPTMNGMCIRAGLRFDQPLMFGGFPSVGRA
ncbi:MAG: hypothetical protein IIC51_09830 [Planctomycetes bacterium]|nr:hypothetical protein [Planctomycetota bacterium]